MNLFQNLLLTLILTLGTLSFLPTFAEEPELLQLDHGHNTGDYNYAFNNMTVSPGEKYIATSGRTNIRIWDAKSKEKLHEIPHSVVSVGRIPQLLFLNDRHLLYTKNDIKIESPIVVWDIEKKKALSFINLPAFTHKMLLSPDNKTLALLHFNVVSLWPMEKVNKIIELASKNDLYLGISLKESEPVEINPYNRYLSDMVFSPDNNHLYVSTQITHHGPSTRHMYKDMAIARVDLKKREITRKYKFLVTDKDDDTVYNITATTPGLTISHDGKTLVFSSVYNKVHLVDLKSGKIKKSIFVGNEDQYDYDADGLTFSLDDKYLITSGCFEPVRVWNLKDGSLETDYTCESCKVEISPESGSILAGGCEG